MSYSCTVKADISLQAIYAGTVHTPTGSNTFYRNGHMYFIERGRENRDGAITVQVMKMLAAGQCQKAGSLRIEPNGAITRPVYLRNAAYKDGFLAIADQYPEDHLYYPLFCQACTENGVLTGDILIIAKVKPKS